MDKEAMSLRAEIAALERELDGGKTSRQASDDSRKTILAEIEELEERLGDEAGCGYMGDEDVAVPEESSMSWMEDDDETEFDGPVASKNRKADEDEDDEDEEDEGGEEVEASLAAPGIEDEITTDKFAEVEKIRGKTGIPTNPSAADAARESQKRWSTAARKAYCVRLMKASDRLDRVAEYLERHGRKDLALRVDKVADAVDARIRKEAR